MKIAIRTLVALLVVTGVAATTQTSIAAVARTSMLPIPVCAPDDPHACGMGTR
jgi:hypothetical protein